MVYRSKSRRIFEICNYTFFILFGITILVPFFNAIAISLSSYSAVVSGVVGLWPVDLQFNGYVRLINDDQFIRAGLNTVFLTIINTVLVIIVSISCAYALSSKYLPAKKVFFYYIIFTMFFNGGLIPTYLVVNGLGLTNTYLALILPSISNAFYIIVFKNSIDQLPNELLQSAEIDGAGEIRILYQIVLPLVLPMTAAFTVFSAVLYWNEWFGVLIYIRDEDLYTLQFQLREILLNAGTIDSQTSDAIIEGADKVHPRNIKMAALMITILPIVAVYPFVQKYFIHGQLVGAVKG